MLAFTVKEPVHGICKSGAVSPLIHLDLQHWSVHETASRYGGQLLDRAPGAIAGTS
jgi:hypothetical protein